MKKISFPCLIALRNIQMIKYHGLLQELTLEIGALEKQKDELEAELKKVIFYNPKGSSFFKTIPTTKMRVLSLEISYLYPTISINWMKSWRSQINLMAILWKFMELQTQTLVWIHMLSKYQWCQTCNFLSAIEV